MAVTYEKTFEIEIINELSASVYNRVLNYVLNHDLFQQPFEELQAIHEYWRSMNQYSKQILTKEKVA